MLRAGTEEATLVSGKGIGIGWFEFNGRYRYGGTADF